MTHSHTERAIIDATDAGWIFDSNSDIVKIYDWEYPEVFLDPEFWKCLGKARGWERCDAHHYECEGMEWRKKWHLFIDHLAEGKDVESFFKQLNQSK